ncbi:MAG: hypothetical protein AOA65_1226 [Candidatus Bathyarchaeota archaeon BA1]|nr:MAG: hypothetical protein AOA65_1226 [Candidatus Bathyarchaeota archaeon BA1]
MLITNEKKVMKHWEYSDSDSEEIRQIASKKSYDQIKQGIIKSLKGIHFDVIGIIFGREILEETKIERVVVGDKIEELILKLNKAESILMP